jgi:hypothetical protein
MLLVIVFDARAFGGQAVPAQDRLFRTGRSPPAHMLAQKCGTRLEIPTSESRASSVKRQ